MSARDIVRLDYRIAADYDCLSNETARLVLDTLADEPDGLYCFAGGDTPVKALQIVSKAARAGDVDISRAWFIELDEWVGLDPDNPGSCASYLKHNLFLPAGIKGSRIHLFDARTTDLDAECTAANTFLEEHGGLTLALLGVGVNGHLGFNEPGCSRASHAHTVPLTETTTTVGAKYFQADGTAVPDTGITLGLEQLLAAQHLVVMANGPRKREAIRKVLNGIVLDDWPVTAMLLHQHPTLIVDREAAK